MPSVPAVPAVPAGVTRDWRELYVVADVHGDSARLAAALAVLDDRPVVLTGDYVDRGPDSSGTLDLLVSVTAQRDDVVPLRGNHEIRLLTFLLDAGAPLLAGGGTAATVRSYAPGAPAWDGAVSAEAPAAVVAAFRSAFPAAHRDLLTRMPLWLETPDLFVSHAGPNPDDPHARTSPALTLGGPERFARAASTPFAKTVACGHFIQRSGFPHLGDHFLAIDLGCGTFPDAPLAVLSWPDRTIRTF